jgi:hypothetical protein
MRYERLIRMYSTKVCEYLTLFDQIIGLKEQGTEDELTELEVEVVERNNIKDELISEMKKELQSLNEVVTKFRYIHIKHS